MPNWCSNSLTITGTPDDIHDMLTEIPTFSFSKIVGEAPDPANWYEWNLENYGTKWDCLETNWAWCTVVADTKYLQLFVRFDSAWSPPTPVVKSLSAKHPNLKITHAYCEIGMDCAAEETWIGGNLLRANGFVPSEHIDYSNVEEIYIDEYFKSFLDEHSLHLGG
jgi:hypothetical protein